DAARLDHLRLLGFYVPGAGDGDGGWRWGLNSEWHSVFPVQSVFWESWGFLSSSQDHALDQRVRDVGRMSEDGRPLVLRQQLGPLADQSVSQWPQLIDQPDIVRARAKVKRPLWRQAILDWGFWILD